MLAISRPRCRSRRQPRYVVLRPPFGATRLNSPNLPLGFQNCAHAAARSLRGSPRSDSLKRSSQAKMVAANSRQHAESTRRTRRMSPSTSRRSRSTSPFIARSTADLSHRTAARRRGSEDAKLKSQLGAAAKAGIRFMIYFGSDEMEAGQVKVKDLDARTEESVARSDVVAYVMTKLGRE